VVSTVLDERHPLPPGPRALFLAARVRALLYSGSPSEAQQIAQREALEAIRRAAPVNPPNAQAAAYVALSEAFLLNVFYREGIVCARRAREYAVEAADDSVMVAAESLLSAGLAMNGELEAANEARRAAFDISQRRGWVRPVWATVLSELYVQARKRDAAALQSVLDAFGDPRSEDAVEQATVSYGRCLVFNASGDYRSVISAAQALIHGVALSETPAFFRERATAMTCIAFTQLGDPASALALVADSVSPPGHTTCYELFRATAYLQLGEPRKALQETETCVRDVPRHSLSTLPSIYLRRAVANELLERTDQADEDYSRASHLAAEIGAVGPALGLDLDVLRRLLHRLIVKEPDFGKVITATIPLDGEYPRPAPLPFTLPRLTEREKVLAGWLVTDRTFVDIAKRLHVSPNTIKTQAKSLYRKLEVSTRAEAVEKLEQTGLFPSTKPPTERA
jgi:DNA-binding CsgD family transcriptional regulator